MAKRIFDFCFALLWLVILSPLFLLIAIALKLDSRGSIFFRQERVGKNFRPFRIFKFRTMLENPSGALVTAANDSRITRIGRFLRRTKLDEFPQLLNVLLGDMSMVGPRPEVPKYVALFPAEQKIILSVRPGITDRASLSGIDEEKILATANDVDKAYRELILPQKLKLQIAYAQNASLRNDLVLIFETFTQVMRRLILGHNKIESAKPQFVYITQVPIDEANGQSVFEKEISAALQEEHIQNYFPHLNLHIFAAARSLSENSSPKLHLLKFKGKSYPHQIAFQIKLLNKLFWFFWKNRKSTTFVFARYHPSMIAPLILQVIFGFRLSLRTGPILPNLKIYEKNPSFIVYQLICFCLKSFYSRSYRIVTVTKKIQDWVCETFAIERSKCVILPNGANIQKFKPMPPNKKHWHIPENRFSIAYIGSLYEDQGVHTVLEAMSILKEANKDLPFFLVVGAGEDLEKLKTLAKNLKLETDTYFTGRVSHDEVPESINSCDLMVAPFTKRAFETTGSSALKLYEYLACNKPVLASAGEDHLFITQNKLGFLAPPEDASAWAKRFEDLMHSQALSTLSDGRPYVLKNHSYTAVATRIIEISTGQN